MLLHAQRVFAAECRDCFGNVARTRYGGSLGRSEEIVADELTLVVADELAGDEPYQRFDDLLHEMRSVFSRMRDVHECQRVLHLPAGETRHRTKIRQTSN